MDFCLRFSDHFVGQGYNSVHHARHYVSGLLGTQRRKNIETIENDVAGANYQGVEQFVSSSPWDHRSLMDEVARAADEALGDPSDACLLVDETSFLKKGKASVGVARQWSGRAGKVENCQVGVFATLGQGGDVAMVDFELYLPGEWAGDSARLDKAKVPLDEREGIAKWRLALEMVRRARERGLRFGWVGADALYGHNNLFLNALEDDGETFVADVRKDFMVWTEEPVVAVPMRKPGSHGAPPKVPRLVDPAQKARSYTRVDELVSERVGDDGGEEIAYRRGSKGELCARFWSVEVWVWDPHRNGAAPRKRTLVVKRDVSGENKYTLTNLPYSESLASLAHKQCERYWIEHAFGEAKSQLGMAQYQVRLWRGWVHHMALVSLALLFTTLEKQRTRKAHPLLSCRDIVELLDHYLPRRGGTEEEVLTQISRRHAARQRDIDRRRKHRTGLPPEDDFN